LDRQIGKASTAASKEHYKRFPGTFPQPRRSGSCENLAAAGKRKSRGCRNNDTTPLTVSFLDRTNSIHLRLKGREFLIELALEVESSERRTERMGSSKVTVDTYAQTSTLIYAKSRDADEKANSSDEIEAFHQFSEKTIKRLFYCLRVLRPDVWQKALSQR